MKRQQAYKYQLQTTGAQQRELRRYAGACRFVFNTALALQQRYYRRFKHHLNYVRLANRLPRWKQHYPFLAMVPSQTLQQSLKDLDRAWANYFAKRADFPRFKKKGLADNFRYPQGCKLEPHNNRLFLPKLGWVKYRNSRQVLGTVKNITVSLTTGKWFASIQTQRDVALPLPATTTAIGIDMGIVKTATLSDGSHIDPINSFKRQQDRLRRAQQSMSRKQKFSHNWQRARARVQKIHRRIANCRQNYLHQATHTLSKNHALVCIEDLQVKAMSRSATGTVEQPGRNVKQKSGLNKAILDQGWAEFRRQLDYKLTWSGGYLIAVPPQYTSQTCPCCGHVARANRQTQAKFACVACGYKNNADVVGAINVLNRGMKMLEGQDTMDASIGYVSTARIACEVNGEVMPSAAGTRRSDSGVTQCQS